MNWLKSDYSLEPVRSLALSKLFHFYGRYYHSIWQAGPALGETCPQIC